jgi:hypothetical protein
MLALDSYTFDMARVLTTAATGTAQAASTAAPFAASDFLSGAGSIPAQFATSIRQEQRSGSGSRTGQAHGMLHLGPDPTFALPPVGGPSKRITGFVPRP